MRNSRSRSTDPEILIQRLEMKHHVLKQRVSELDCRSFLTADEVFERAKLKKQKLATKDALAAYRRDLSIES